MKEDIFRSIIEANGMVLVDAILSRQGYIMYAVCRQGKVHYIYDALGRAYYANNLQYNDRGMINISCIVPSLMGIPMTSCPTKDVKSLK